MSYSRRPVPPFHFLQSIFSLSGRVALRRGYMLSDFPDLCHIPGNVKCMSALIQAKGVWWTYLERNTRLYKVYSKYRRKYGTGPGGLEQRDRV